MDNTLAQVEDANYFTKIDIHQAFCQITIFEDSEQLTTFFTRFAKFKYLMMPFDLCTALVS